jgi:hypothetical protein
MRKKAIFRLIEREGTKNRFGRDRLHRLQGNDGFVKVKDGFDKKQIYTGGRDNSSLVDIDVLGPLYGQAAHGGKHFSQVT